MRCGVCFRVCRFRGTPQYKSENPCKTVVLQGFLTFILRGSKFKIYLFACLTVIRLSLHGLGAARSPKGIDDSFVNAFFLFEI
jgi:hypothetical protein